MLGSLEVLLPNTLYPIPSIPYFPSHSFHPIPSIPYLLSYSFHPIPYIPYLLSHSFHPIPSIPYLPSHTHTLQPIPSIPYTPNISMYNTTQVPVEHHPIQQHMLLTWHHLPEFRVSRISPCACAQRVVKHAGTCYEVGDASWELAGRMGHGRTVTFDWPHVWDHIVLLGAGVL